MKIVTFYSFKGGVGRSLALINVAHALASMGQRVVMVDLDLEAPGLGRTAATGGESAWKGSGVSDLLLGWVTNNPVSLKDCLRPVAQEGKGTLWLMPAGTRPTELSHRIPSLLQDPSQPQAKVFKFLIHQLQNQIKPDVVLLDSRTGLADVAGVCTVELPDAVVAVCGLNEQNVAGMAVVLDQIVHHVFREGYPPTLLLALSPVPSRDWMGAPPEIEFRDILRDPDALPALAGARRATWDRVSARVHMVLERLRPSVEYAFKSARRRAPGLRADDLYHVLEHDPEVPLLGELLLARPSGLADQYQRLTRSIAAGVLGLPVKQVGERPLRSIEGPRDV
ncbi:MAG: hypothetical protein EA397_17385 [Deltaproteobacteria bacterium]|nr:MAG: hypothetical protein EA397_17385 [Deltaproteobacteria bacterium]